MFDITSSKLFILGAIALIVVGPKDLPVLLRTIGKYLAMIRRQATEFRATFDEALKETELQTIQKDIEKVGRDAEDSIRESERAMNDEIAKANAAIETTARETEASVDAAANSGHVSIESLPVGRELSVPTVGVQAVEPAKVGA